MRIVGDSQGRRGGVVDGGPRELGRLPAGTGAVGACHCPTGDGVRISAKRVVTGGKSGLRASRGKDRDKNFSREALVTGWYGAATTELPPAAWSAEADVGAERRNQVPLSRSIAMSRGQTPRPRHDGPLLTGGGLAQPKRRGGCRADSCGHAATGEPPGIDEASEPWRVALQAGPGALTPWPCGRTATLASAARRNRARGRCRTTDTPQPPHGSASVKASRALSQHLLRLRRSRTARDGSPISTQLPHARPGAAMRTRGAVDTCFAPPRTGGANPVVARSVTRRTRPSHSSGSGVGRTGRCAGTRPRPDRC